MARLAGFRAFLSPVERELFHWWPGHDALFVELVGCNARCPWCPRETIAHATPTEVEGLLQVFESSHERVVLTGGEVAVNIEQVLEFLDEAQKSGCEVAVKTCGLVCEEALADLSRRVSACVVYVFGTDEVYERYLSIPRGFARVLTSLEILVRRGVHVEVSYLALPGVNTQPEVARPVFEALRELDVVVHLRRCVPGSEFKGRLPATNRDLQRLYRLAQAVGLPYVYITDAWSGPWRNTFCRSCGELLIERVGWFVSRVRLDGASCPRCGARVPLVGRARESISLRFLDLPHYILTP